MRRGDAGAESIPVFMERGRSRLAGVEGPELDFDGVRGYTIGQYNDPPFCMSLVATGEKGSWGREAGTRTRGLVGFFEASASIEIQATMLFFSPS